MTTAVRCAVWARSPDPASWVAGGPGGLLLAVTRLAGDRWRPAVAGPDGRATWTGEPCSTRLGAQGEAEREAGL